MSPSFDCPAFVAGLREAVRSSGATQTEIGRRAGLTQTQISLFKRGVGMSADNLDRIAHALGLRIELVSADEAPRSRR
jgi:transcriptional regulator with XRE-family HTH domain